MAGEDTYARIAQHAPHDSDAAQFGEPSRVRPATYYGDGPFEPPSSDEEDELLEKPPGSPGAVGRLEEDAVLVVGSPRHQVCCCSLVGNGRRLRERAALGTFAVPAHMLGGARGACGVHWCAGGAVV